MKTKKVWSIAFVLLAISAILFIGLWATFNWNKVEQGMSGTGLYTQADLQKAKEEGYNEALVDNDTTNEQLNYYKTQTETLTRLLRDEQNSKESLVRYYEEVIASLESENTAVVTFKVNGEIYDVQSIQKGQSISLLEPEIEAYTFNGWTLNGEDVTFPYLVESSVVFEANLTRQSVTFITGTEFNRLYPTLHEHSAVIFDFYSSPDRYILDNVNVIYGIQPTSVCDGKVKIYDVDNKIIVLSNYDILANENCSGMFNNTNATLGTFGTSFYITAESNLSTIKFNNFNTNAVSNMSAMFYGCAGLRSLDVSSFNTFNVTEMSRMFAGCINLVTIYASDNFVTTNVEASDLMFLSDKKLVGENGTTYEEGLLYSKTTANRAVIDTPQTPGYFTLKSN